MEDEDAALLVPPEGMVGEDVPVDVEDAGVEVDEPITLEGARDVAALELCGNDDDGALVDDGTPELERPPLEVPATLVEERPPWLLDAASTLQKPSQPSPGSLLPSSHSSARRSHTPSPHVGLRMEDAWVPEDDVDESWLLQRPLASQVLPGAQSAALLHTMPWVHPTVSPTVHSRTTRPSRLWFMAAPVHTRRRPARPT